MKQLLDKFESKEPEIVFEWQDTETEAKGWLVINSLRGGACGGGTRMRKGLNQREVESLAKTMELKFAVSGPAIGGAKSGIDFDPDDPRKHDVLRRWFKAINPLLYAYYGTGGDMNVDQVTEVIPFTEEAGLWHPQEGVLNGHFNLERSQKIRRINQLRTGVLKVIEHPKYTPDINRNYVVAQMVTGYGVAHSIVSYYDIWGGNIKDKKVIIQGWGNVGASAAYHLARQGARIVGIIELTGGLIKEEGFTFEEIRELFLTKKENKLSTPHLLSFEEVNARIWDVKADIFVPCAASRLITMEQVQRMIDAGTTLITPGANVPFADKEIFYGNITAYVDDSISLLPDFIANLGIARVFAYLNSNDLEELVDEEIFKDVETTIEEALTATHKINNGKTKIAEKSFEIILNQLI